MIWELIRYRLSAGRWTWYRGKLLKNLFGRCRKGGTGCPPDYTCEGEQRLQANDWIRIAHISKYLPQNVGRQDELRVLQQMDSVYAALQGRRGFCNAGPPVLG